MVFEAAPRFVKQGSTQTQDGRRGLNMCQYTTRCAVGTHRPGTKCPLAGSGSATSARLYTPPSQVSSAVRPVSPSPSTSRTTTSGTTGAGTQGSGAARRSNTASAIVGGLDAADLIGLSIFAAVVGGKDQPVNTASIVTAVLLVAVPALIAVWLGSQCRVWNADGLSRCSRRTARLFGRCGAQGHRRGDQLLLLPEVMAGASVVVAVISAIASLRLLL
jgi:hypothetical protein